MNTNTIITNELLTIINLRVTKLTEQMKANKNNPIFNVDGAKKVITSLSMIYGKLCAYAHNGTLDRNNANVNLGLTDFEKEIFEALLRDYDIFAVNNFNELHKQEIVPYNNEFEVKSVTPAPEETTKKGNKLLDALLIAVPTITVAVGIMAAAIGLKGCSKQEEVTPIVSESEDETITEVTPIEDADVIVPLDDDIIEQANKMDLGDMPVTNEEMTDMMRAFNDIPNKEVTFDDMVQFASNTRNAVYNQDIEFISKAGNMDGSKGYENNFKYSDMLIGESQGKIELLKLEQIREDLKSGNPEVVNKAVEDFALYLNAINADVYDFSTKVLINDKEVDASKDIYFRTLTSKEKFLVLQMVDIDMQLVEVVAPKTTISTVITATDRDEYTTEDQILVAKMTIREVYESINTNICEGEEYNTKTQAYMGTVYDINQRYALNSNLFYNETDDAIMTEDDMGLGR